MTSSESPPVVMVLGDAGPLVQRSAEGVVAEGLSRCGIPAFNHARHRGGGGVMDAIAAANTPPMMSDLRLVEVRDLHEATPEELEALVDYTESPSPSTLLLLVGSGLPTSGKGKPNFGVRLKNAVKRVGRVIEHKASEVNLPRFVVDVAQSAGKRMSSGDAALLVEWLGTDVGRLEAEVNKLALFVGERPVISGDDVREGSALLGEAEIWSLTGAIASRDVDAAVAATHRLVSGGADARHLLAMIAWQMREIIKVSEWARAGLSDADIRQRGRVKFDVLKAVRRAGEDAPTAASTMSRLARANRAMNEHRAGDVRVLEELVLALCGQG